MATLKLNRRRISVIDQRIASRLHILQIDRLARAEGCAEAMVRAIRAEVVHAIAVATSARTANRNERKRRVAEILAGATRKGIDACTAGQRELARWTHTQVARIMVETVPRNWWRRAEPALALFEKIEDAPKKRTIKLGGKNSPLRADIRTEPVKKKLKDDEWEDLLLDVIFPPPTKEKIDRVVFGDDPVSGRHWNITFPGRTSKLNDPAFADKLVDGYSQGMNVDELTQLILPAEQDTYWRARRTARTESLRIANKMQRESMNDLGDMLLGMQVLAVLDQNTRPEHAERNGTIYYVDGTPSIDEMPDLPDEPNCRCWDAPVLKPPDEFLDDPVVMASFLNDDGLAIPDPAVYDQWFDAAPVGAQKDAVGVARYNTMAATLGNARKPEWSDFLDPTTAKLLSPTTLRGETDQERAERKEAVNATMRERENLIKQVASRGFLLPPRDSGTAKAGN